MVRTAGLVAMLALLSGGSRNWVREEIYSGAFGSISGGSRSSGCYLLLLPNVMEHRSLLVVCFYFYQISERSPMERRAPAQSSSRDQCT